MTAGRGTAELKGSRASQLPSYSGPSLGVTNFEIRKCLPVKTQAELLIGEGVMDCRITS